VKFKLHTSIKLNAQETNTTAPHFNDASYVQQTALNVREERSALPVSHPMSSPVRLTCATAQVIHRRMARALSAMTVSFSMA